MFRHKNRPVPITTGTPVRLYGHDMKVVQLMVNQQIHNSVTATVDLVEIGFWLRQNRVSDQLEGTTMKHRSKASRVISRFASSARQLVGWLATVAGAVTAGVGMGMGLGSMTVFGLGLALVGLGTAYSRKEDRT